MGAPVRLVAGLGNPGPEYVATRHNVGFRILDHLAIHEGLLFRSARNLDGYGGPRAFSWARLFSPEALLLKPETFMNRSGTVVAPVARHVLGDPPDPARLLVVYDDLDLAPSGLRIRPHGGAGGHNGMRSIIQCLDTDRFPRLRVGIGRPGTDAARHVLAPFSEAEEEDIAISVAEASEAILFWLQTGDIERCMTRFHSRWNRDS
ncbi:MAG: aminoacyl-tRNA hydrolase [Planctomycetota bacterium]|nr:MAG: aminoacyl-tRNA hydrolase [Planctomycetota bacterium]